MDIPHVFAGLMVGVLVGLTGVGGGSLMTPVLVLLFGVHPVTAVGTDLLYAACTKCAGTLVHGRQHTIEWGVVGRLALGSLPMAALMILVLNLLPHQAALAGQVITPALAVVLLVSAALMLLRSPLIRLLGPGAAGLAPGQRTALTAAAGVVLGVLIPLTSVGAGALGDTALMLLYPRLSTVAIVGSDIAHAVPLTFLSGLGYLYMGAVDWPLMGTLLAGSLPGIVLGSLVANRVPGLVLRIVVAATLTVVAVRLLL